MRQDSGTIKRALGVLREAAEAGCAVQTRGVALALWVLRGSCPDEWLVGFWKAAGPDRPFERSQMLNAYYNGIALRVQSEVTTETN